MKEFAELERKARAYDEALEKAKRLYEKGTITESLCYIFPELKESEGEMVRKDIISYLHNEKKVKRYISDIEFDKWIAWLEKQGEKLTQQEVTKISDQVEDSAWSEEDEINFQGIMNEIKANKHEAPDYDIPIYNRYLCWLESIKQRIGG